MAPIVDGLETQFAGQVAFQRIEANTAEGPAIMDAYQVLGHPTILILDRAGEERQRFVGPQPGEILAETLQQILKANQE